MKEESVSIGTNYTVRIITHSLLPPSSADTIQSKIAYHDSVKINVEKALIRGTHKYGQETKDGRSAKPIGDRVAVRESDCGE